MVAGSEMKKEIFLFAVVSAIAVRAAWLPANAPDSAVADGAADAKIEIAGDSAAAALLTTEPKYIRYKSVSDHV